MEKLTEKQKLFCDEYLIDFNGTRAYKIAYPNIKSDDVAAAAASRLLTNVKIKAYLDKRIKDREKRTEITQDRVLKELSRIAFFDIRKLFDEDGNLKRIVDLDEDTAAAIASFEVLEEFVKGDLNGLTKKLKTNDKKGALELAGRHLGMWNDKLDTNIKFDSPPVVFMPTPKGNDE